ncbi:MAG: hypothetical protein HXS50_04845, partial [Theionarchaea archaeon]|nr:hypothetical protein [Theionarchaea archaeon]
MVFWITFFSPLERTYHMLSARSFILLLIFVLLIPSVSAAPRIRVLLLGQVTPEHCPAPAWFGYEPMVEYFLVPTKLYFQMTYADAQRQIRVYFPRGKENVWNIDFFMFINPYFEPFIPSQIDDMRMAIVEGGSGAFQSLGGITIDWTNVNWPWIDSALAPVFPNDPLAYEVWEGQKEGNMPYKVIVNEDPSLPPVLKMFVPLGIEEVRGYWTIVLIIPQPGATIWARARGAYPKAPEVPPAWLLSWRYGKGMTWSVADDLDCPWWADTYHPSDQDYGLDILMNIALHSLGRPLPTDIVLVNAVRRDFMLYTEKSSTIAAFFDFVERFGVSSSRLLYEKLAVDSIIEEAMGSYLEGRYEDSLDLAEEAHQALGD